MTDILSDLRAVANVNGDTYSSAEVIAMVRRAAEEVERLRADLDQMRGFRDGLAKIGAELGAENERLRADPWKHGAESMRQTILQQLPGGQSCDPQQIADMIRAIGVPGADDEGGECVADGWLPDGSWKP